MNSISRSARKLALFFTRMAVGLQWATLYYVIRPLSFFYFLAEKIKPKKSFRKALRRSLLLGTTTMLLLLFLANHEVKKVARGKTFDHLEEIEKTSVGLLLGTGKYTSRGGINPYYKARLEAASKLYHEGKVCAIIISGDHGRPTYNEPLQFKEDLIQLGVPETVLYLDYAGFSTLDSMIRAKAIFGQTSLIVISQEFHNQRAIYLAEKHGVTAVGFNAKAVKGSFALKTNLREYLARTKAFLDMVCKRGATFLGPQITIDA